MFKLTPFSASPRKRDDFVDFYDVLDDFFSTSPFRTMKHDTFKIDVRDEDKFYAIEADLPGVERDEVKVSYDDQTLSISVERKEEKEDKDTDGKYLHRERRVCSMKRSIYLPEVDPAKIKARLEDGVLKVLAEKTEAQASGYVIDVE